MRKPVTIFLLAVLATLSGLWFLTATGQLPASALPDHEPDPDNGAQLFYAGACASCHASPGSEEAEPAVLGGGREIETDFGLFRVPNISPDPFAGTGRWTQAEFVNAMKNGVSPQGNHYYPAFPYTSYTRMTLEDIMDLKAYLETLPAVSGAVGGHELHFPWNLRRGIGLWKLRYLDADPVISIDESDAVLVRGRYLAEGPAHCAECHSPRDAAGGTVAAQWLAGAPNPDGKGRIPNITPHEDGLGSWSTSDIVYYLTTGMTPDFDTAGGSMVAVQENLARLAESDRKAIVAYLKAIPARPGTAEKARDAGD